MTVTLYPIAKRINSTKRPTAGGKAFSCVLKTPSSVMNPKISIKWDPATGGSDLHPSAYNYAYINDYQRYYWINEWTYDDRQWMATMSVDVLASWRDTIRTSSKYVLRANVDDNNPYIADRKYPAKCATNSYMYGFGSGVIDWDISLGGGSYIVGIVGSGNTYNTSGLFYVYMSAAEFNALVTACFTQSLAVWSATSTLGQNLGEVFQRFGENWLKTLIKPFDYIRSVVWFPFEFPHDSTGQAIHLGLLDTQSSGHAISKGIHVIQQMTTIATLQNVPTAADPLWKKIPPYAEAKLVFPPFGVFPLDLSVIGNYLGQVRMDIVADAVTGMARLEVYSGSSYSSPSLPGRNSTHLLTASAQLGVPINISGTFQDYGAALRSVGNAVSAVSAAYSAPSPGSIVGAVSAVTDGIQSAMPQIVSGGQAAGLSGIQAGPYVVYTFRQPVDQDKAEFGVPVCEIRTLGDISGFIQCADPEIELPIAYQDEIRQVGEYLTGGFFNE